MSRTPFLILNFLDFDVYEVMTPIFPANQRRCASSSRNVAILSLWSRRAIIAPNNLIDSHHYKRDKKIRMTEFHSPSLSILIITQSKASFLVILNYSKMIPRRVEKGAKEERPSQTQLALKNQASRWASHSLRPPILQREANRNCNRPQEYVYHSAPSVRINTS